MAIGVRLRKNVYLKHYMRKQDESNYSNNYYNYYYSYNGTNF
jgi:hypothetical protein